MDFITFAKVFSLVVALACAVVVYLDYSNEREMF
jgi:hypothetical protein